MTNPLLHSKLLLTLHQCLQCSERASALWAAAKDFESHTVASPMPDGYSAFLRIAAATAAYAIIMQSSSWR